MPDKKTILIADDDLTSIQYLIAIFKNPNYNIIAVTNGIDALKVCNDHPEIDLVLMDLRMPEMNGYDAFIKIREAKPDLPIIATTAFAMLDYEERANRIGFTEYVIKPITVERLGMIQQKYLC